MGRVHGLEIVKGETNDLSFPNKHKKKILMKKRRDRSMKTNSWNQHIETVSPSKKDEGPLQGKKMQKIMGTRGQGTGVPSVILQLYAKLSGRKGRKRSRTRVVRGIRFRKKRKLHFHRGAAYDSERGSKSSNIFDKS